MRMGRRLRLRIRLRLGRSLSKGGGKVDEGVVLKINGTEEVIGRWIDGWRPLVEAPFFACFPWFKV